MDEDHWYFHLRGERKGKPVGQCIRCCRAKGRKDGSTANVGRAIPASRLQKYAVELVNRMGHSEALRYSGLHDSTLRRIKQGREDVNIQRPTAARLIASLRQARKEGILRHKNSIKHGAKNRRPTKVKAYTRKANRVVKTEHTVPEHVRPAAKERKAMRPSEQLGPVFPELEAEARAEHARYKRERWAEMSDEDRKKLSKARLDRAHRQQEREDQLDRLTGY